jgi:hypothetical protein
LLPRLPTFLNSDSKRTLKFSYVTAPEFSLVDPLTYVMRFRKSAAIQPLNLIAYLKPSILDRSG